MVLDDISRDHIIQAIELIDNEGIKKESKGYIVYS